MREDLKAWIVREEEANASMIYFDEIHDGEVAHTLPVFWHGELVAALDVDSRNQVLGVELLGISPRSPKAHP